MVSLKRNSFAAGFLTAAVSVIACVALNNIQFQGGHVEDSPTGKYALTIMAPVSPTIAGTYKILLIENATGNTIRAVEIQLNSKERTKPLRGLPVTTVWDAAESSVDIMVDGTFLVGISMPPDFP